MSTFVHVSNGNQWDKHTAEVAQEAKANVPLLQVSPVVLSGGFAKHIIAFDLPLQPPRICPKNRKISSKSFNRVSQRQINGPPWHGGHRGCIQPGRKTDGTCGCCRFEDDSTWVWPCSLGLKRVQDCFVPALQNNKCRAQKLNKHCSPCQNCGPETLKSKSNTWRVDHLSFFTENAWTCKVSVEPELDTLFNNLGAFKLYTGRTWYVLTMEFSWTQALRIKLCAYLSYFAI